MSIRGSLLYERRPSRYNRLSYTVNWFSSKTENTMMTSSNENIFRISGPLRGIHRWPLDPHHEGHGGRALMFSLIYAWTNSWVNNRDAGDLKRDRAHHDVSLMPRRLDRTLVWSPGARINSKIRKIVVGIFNGGKNGKVVSYSYKCVSMDNTTFRSKVDFLFVISNIFVNLTPTIRLLVWVSYQYPYWFISILA